MMTDTMLLTPQEQRLQGGKGYTSRARTNALLAGFREETPRIDIERAVLFTESMRQTEAYPLVLRWAMAFAHVCEHIEVVIEEHELIVGTCGGRGRHAILYPELRAGWYVKGLPETQKKNAFTISDEDIKTVLEEVVPYWQGKTSHEMYLAIMPPETRAVIYGDDDYGSTGLMQDNSNVSSTLNWPGNYDEVMTKGLKAFKQEAQEKLAAIRKTLVTNDYDKVPFLQAEILVCDALETLARRYSDKARELLEEEQDQKRRRERCV